eukprot:11289841-Alexandrium_andersonii.AAC.1
MPLLLPSAGLRCSRAPSCTAPGLLGLRSSRAPDCGASESSRIAPESSCVTPNWIGWVRSRALIALLPVRTSGKVGVRNA